MTFLLRAALVIGALSYMAAMRGEPAATGGAAVVAPRPVAADAGPPSASKGSTPLAAFEAVSATWSALPADARQRLAQEAMAELGRHAAPAATSRDTLAEADRKAAWRGAEAR